LRFDNGWGLLPLLFFKKHSYTVVVVVRQQEIDQ
jgi:hypothetical protein